MIIVQKPIIVYINQSFLFFIKNPIFLLSRNQLSLSKTN